MSLDDRLVRLGWRAVQIGLVGLTVWTLVALRWARLDREGPNVLWVPVRLEADAEVHLYYDVGHGLWAGDVEVQQVPGSPAWRVLRFAVPREPVRAMRFDPMLTAGKFAVKAPWLTTRSGRRIATFPHSAVIPRLQIASWQDTGDAFEAETVADADDAQVWFGIGGSLRVGGPRWPWIEALVLLGLLVAEAVIGRHPALTERKSWKQRGLWLVAMMDVVAAGIGRGAGRLGRGVGRGYRRIDTWLDGE